MSHDGHFEPLFSYTPVKTESLWVSVLRRFKVLVSIFISDSSCFTAKQLVGVKQRVTGIIRAPDHLSRTAEPDAALFNHKLLRNECAHKTFILSLIVSKLRLTPLCSVFKLQIPACQLDVGLRPQ